VPVDSAVLAAIASPRRREILRLVWDREVPAGEIGEAMPEITLGAVSLQLKALREAGLVEIRRDGRRRWYRARRAAFGEAARMLESMWADALDRLRVQAELEEARRGPRPGRRPTRHPGGNVP
jgi:DNA-binding transcriptional ArsR family regulator